MSPNVSPTLDMAELASGLPSLICETDIEKQIANIEKWLKPFIPLSGIGLSISGYNCGDSNIFFS
jgi:hypothetical protein